MSERHCTFCDIIYQGDRCPECTQDIPLTADKVRSIVREELERFLAAAQKAVDRMHRGN